MKQKIRQLENLARYLEPEPDQRKEWNQAIQNYADEFLNTISTAKAFNKPDPIHAANLKIPLEETPREVSELLKILKENLDTPGINPASGRHFGYIPGGGVFPTAMGDYLAAVTNRYAGIVFANPGAVRIENEMLRWMCSMIGYPDTALGNLTSGGSIANLIAIVTARDKKGIRSKDVQHSVIYFTKQVHHCVHKAIRIAGLAECILRIVPVDEQYRMIPHVLKSMIREDLKNNYKPFLVVASAGTTDTGTVDPLDAIADIAETFDLWYHVDAAYGGFFLLVDALKSIFNGIERSDSVAIDPHKGLFLSYGSGALLIKDTKALFQSHYYKAAYMQDAFSIGEEPSPADLSPELTKHFRGLRMWIALHLFGLKPFRASLEEKYWLCRYFYEEIQKHGFEVGPIPELSVCIYRYLPSKGDANTFNLQLVEYVQEDGRIFLSSTTIDGIFWIRLAVLSFRTHLDTVDMCLDILKEGVRYLENKSA